MKTIDEICTWKIIYESEIVRGTIEQKHLDQAYKQCIKCDGRDYNCKRYYVLK